MDSPSTPTVNPVAVSLDEALGTLASPADASRASDDYQIITPNFEGPLDLLLHLIRKEQVDIYDIPIAQICRSYLEHLELLQQPDCNLAGEFMLMAATLTHMKSQILLPRDEGEDAADDPREPLVAQLLEYEKFKKAADQLDARPWLYRDIYPRPSGATTDLIPVETLLDAPIDPIDTFQMLLCLKVAVDRTTKKPLQITADVTSLKDKVITITERFEMSEIVDFRSLMPPAHRHKDIIISFLAVLELAKLKFIEIIQHENFGPIQIRSVRPLRELNASLLDQY